MNEKGDIYIYLEKVEHDTYIKQNNIASPSDRTRESQSKAKAKYAHMRIILPFTNAAAVQCKGIKNIMSYYRCFQSFFFL